jgi:hypothetical protein
MTFKTRPAPSAFSAWKFRAYKLDEKRAAALLESWFDATSTLPNDCFSAWVMNGSQVTILMTTIGSRDAKRLVSARLKIAGMTTRNTSGGPTTLSKALPWYYANAGPILFKNSSAGYYSGMDDVRAALPGVFEQVLKTPGVIFQVNTLGGAITESTPAHIRTGALPYLGEQQAYWERPARRSAASQQQPGFASASPTQASRATTPITPTSHSRTGPPPITARTTTVACRRSSECTTRRTEFATQSVRVDS